MPGYSLNNSKGGAGKPGAEKQKGMFSELCVKNKGKKSSNKLIGI